MKRLLFILLLSCSFLVRAEGVIPRKSIASVGAGNIMCPDWIIKRTTNGYYYDTYGWIMGYISAYNNFNYQGNYPKGLFSKWNADQIMAYIDDTCRRHSDFSVSLAVSEFVNSISMSIPTNDLLPGNLAFYSDKLRTLIISGVITDPNSNYVYDVSMTLEQNGMFKLDKIKQRRQYPESDWDFLYQ